MIPSAPAPTRAHSILPRLLLGATRGLPAAPATPVARGLVALVAFRSPFAALLAALRAAASGSSSPIASLVAPLFLPPPPPPSSRAEFILLFHALALAYPPVSPAAYFLNAGDPPVAAIAPVVLRRCSARLSPESRSARRVAVVGVVGEVDSPRPCVEPAGACRRRATPL